MKSFRDANGVTWDIVGKLSLFERVKTETGVDLLDLATADQKSLQQLGDPYTLGHVLYQFCATQAESRGLTPEQFADSFNADALNEASSALLEEVIFFCRGHLRPVLMKAVEKAKEMDRRMVEVVEGRMDEIASEIDKAVEAMKTSTNSATNLPASSASTPANGRSAASSGRRGGRRKTAGSTPLPS